ncbi:hypothetical protein P152DRAFT_470180 [Eremomyces bilateralis CBS 781.70]|uniref:Uncharacterized protein n=1 Tax=Eremomyces bilateralis CBS 781.70 TaxID=1392243 RepID=A0A6G1GE02_9PEZI|nr:uncharacterized protein P152DRAFT_470180 [Eremomyces bilateralis CBS 781.70]KAF1816136.1 hypothetical protein P152DRAFT_470180 [Eremomyces bilateralis CBS 781.70]
MVEAAVGDPHANSHESASQKRKREPSDTPHPSPSHPTSAFLPTPSNEAEIPAPAPQNSHQSAAMSLNLSQGDLQALRSGVRNPDGDMVYFLPSFIEDPWARLKKGVANSGEGQWAGMRPDDGWKIRDEGR